MIGFNKFLNVLILILAILACTSSVLLSNKRKQLVDYNKNLSEEIAASGSTLVGTEGKETGLLDENLKADVIEFKDYLTDADGTTAKLKELSAGTTKIVAAKEILAENLLDVAKALKTPNTLTSEDGKDSSIDTAKSLQNVTSEKTATAIAEIKNQAIDIVKHDDALIAAILESSETIGKTISPEALSDYNDKSYTDTTKIFKGNVKSLKLRADKLTDGYAKSIKSLQDTFPQYNFSASLDDVQSEDADKYEIAVDDFVKKDIRTIVGKLKKYVKSERVIAKLKSDILEKSEAIAKLNKELGDAKNEIATERVKVLRLNKRIQNIEVRYGIRKPILPAHIVANVIQTNDQWDFVILDKGRDDDLAEKGEMLVHRNGEMVCKVRISKVHKNMSVADIVNPVLKVSQPVVGDKAIVQP